MAHLVRVSLLVLCLTGRAMAADGPVRLAVPDVLVTSGLMAHLLPRFTLKTQVRVEIVPEGTAADLRFGTDGAAVFADPGRTWHLSDPGDHAGAARFADWLTSEIGRKAVTSYAPGGVTLFTLPVAGAARVADVTYDGDAELGLAASREHCARCHAVEAGGRINSIGSSPSFAVLKSFDDWPARFEAFYALNPHPAFTQIAEITPPFPKDRPSPIAPVELTLDDLEAIVAYVAGLDAAELGAPLRHQ